MSRIGKQILKIPNNTEVHIDNMKISIKGIHGEITKLIPESLTILKKDSESLEVIPKIQSRETRALHGLFRSLINNMLIGVSKRFVKILDLKGVGYKVSLEKGNLILSLGFTHPINIKPPADVVLSLEGNTTIKVQGIDKEKVGLIAQQIKFLRPPEPYKGKGILYRGEIIQRKVGKSSK